MQRFARTDQDPAARVFVAPSEEAGFLVRRFGGLVAPAPGAETWGSRLVAMLVVAPFTQFTVFSFYLQAFLYDVFHQRLPAKLAHLLVMPAVNFFVVAGLAQVSFGPGPANLGTVYAGLLLVWYLLTAARTGMRVWGLVMVPVVAALGLGANLYAASGPPAAQPWLLAVGCAAVIAVSHGPERRLPPRVTGSDTWLSFREFLGGEMPWRTRSWRVLLIAVQPVSGTVNEFVASPRLMPFGVLMLMFRLGYRPDVHTRLREHVRLATGSGNPALDYVGIGGGTRLDAAAFRPAPERVA